MERNFAAVKTAALAVLAAVGSVASAALGGWDAALQTLLIFMATDCATGLMVAGVFKRSGKSEGGRLDSRAGFKGLCKKGAELILVLVAVRLDGLLGDAQYARMAVMLFFIGNEGLSVLENLGLMGVPYPAFIRNALEVMREQGDKGQGEQDETEK
ncbi:MAG: phage holin family protein [Pseudoflavonifractor sp.]